MLITQVTINKHISERLGLAEHTLKDLTDLVVLVGPNGAGKTRLLKAVHWLLTQVAVTGYSRLKKNSKRIGDLAAALNSDCDMDQYTTTSFFQDRDALSALIDPQTGLDLMFEAGEDEKRALELYVEVSRYLSGTEKPERDELTSRLYMGIPRVGEAGGLDWLSMSPLQYLEDACLRYARIQRQSAEWPDGTLGVVETDGIRTSFDALAALVLDLTGLRLTMDQDGNGRINDIPFPALRLSRGQDILIRWVVLFHSQVLTGKSVPVLLDEPELHLHPKALNTLVDRLRAQCPNTQLWIATHSLSLVAHLAVQYPRAIWYGDNGKFQPAGKKFQDVVTGLAGGDGAADELVDFCGAVSEFATHSFAADCLLAPSTVAYKERDPQVEQIVRHFAQKNARPLVVLDFGAGQGRLLDGLSVHCTELGLDLRKTIDYYAVEPWEPLRQQCAHKVSAYYGDGIARVFSSAKEARSTLEANVHFVILANVLHEILPEHWLSDVFGSIELAECIRDDGEVLIVEDTVLPRGELAHRYGFIILQTEALRKLVRTSPTTEHEFTTSTVARYGQRLQATRLGKNALAKVNKSSIRDALEHQLNATLQAVRELRDVRQGHYTYQDGRIHSYHAQLATNISLALEDLRKLGW